MKRWGSGLSLFCPRKILATPILLTRAHYLQIVCFKPSDTPLINQKSQHITGIHTEKFIKILFVLHDEGRETVSSGRSYYMHVRSTGELSTYALFTTPIIINILYMW
jgi:hypothetical protein